MIGNTYASFLVSDTSHTGSLRRAVRELALANELPAEAVSRAEIVATELATNLIKHVDTGGEILLGSAVAGDHIKAVEMLALDKGRGMGNPDLMLTDGVSTTGTLGGGLGAIKRLSDEFDIHSQVGRGTAIFSRIWTRKIKPKWQQNGAEIAGIIVPYPGEQVSGDRWAIRRVGDKITILLADGLGHGQKAALAAEESVRVFLSATSLRPADLLRQMHEALQHTQGAAVAIAELDSVGETLTYSGLGNISGRLCLSGEVRGCVSMSGGVGFQWNKAQEFTYPWTEQSLLLMNSDGLTSSVNPIGLTKHHGSLIAAILYRDFRRNADDTVVIVARSRRRK